jgi:hypothetical protein
LSGSAFVNNIVRAIIFLIRASLKCSNYYALDVKVFSFISSSPSCRIFSVVENLYYLLEVFKFIDNLSRIVVYFILNVFEGYNASLLVSCFIASSIIGCFDAGYSYSSKYSELQ